MFRNINKAGLVIIMVYACYIQVLCYVGNGRSCTDDSIRICTKKKGIECERCCPGQCTSRCQQYGERVIEKCIEICTSRCIP